MEPTTTTVILPGRDVASVIGDQLDALALQQGADPWELVFVDDRSTDDTVAVVGRYVERIQLRIIRIDRPTNAYGARNAGLRAARGELVVCCDADDIVPSGWLAAMQRALRDYDVVGGPTRYWWPDRDRISQQAQNTVDRLHLGFLPFAVGGSFGCRREVLEHLGGWDQRLPSGGDVDLSWRAQLAGYTLGPLPDSAALLYRQREGAGPAFKQTYRQGKAQVATYERFRGDGVPQRALATTIVDWVTLLRKLPGAIRSRQITGWAWHAGAACGRLVGSVQHRRWFL